MTDSPTGEVTTLLRRMAEGSGTARGQLAELVYAELRTMAARQLRGARGHTLQPTALVHEAWLKLAGSEADFGSRQHFLGVAAKAMRSVLVDHVRRKRTGKRGGQAQTTSLDDAVAFLEAGEVDLLDLDAALAELESDDPVLARLVEMRFFSGMTNVEVAAVEGCSESTIERGWRVARARLRRRLSRPGDA
ncbi:MAG TPA: ECF-type sigma factor [Planctomycetota bacterium]|nr:ECF-type sigma factor [Planctomycetota bacterium]